MTKVKAQDESIDLVIQYINDEFGKIVTTELNKKLKEAGLPNIIIDGKRLHDVIMHGLEHEHVNIMFAEDLCEMINWAVRYAIGRKTYAVSDTCNFVTKNIKKFNNKTLNVIIEDIDRAEKDKLVKDPLGDPVVDAPHWFELRNLCRKELNERGVEE